MKKTILGKRERRCKLVDVCGGRELGDILPTTFNRRVRASENFILRLGIERKLVQHRGCVNTVSFNANGSILLSGSDDRVIVLWDWDAGSSKFSFESGHSDNVFQALFMPHSNDRTIVTCSADAEVRHARLHDGGGVLTEKLAKHNGAVHSMAIEPENTHIFYSCGEDGVVHRFDLRTKSSTKLFICTFLEDRMSFSPVISLNAIVIDPRSPNQLAVAGSDEYVRLYDTRMCYFDGSTNSCHPTDCFCPPHLVGSDEVGVTGLAFSDSSELLASYTNDCIYLFTAEHGLGASPFPASHTSDTDSHYGSEQIVTVPSSVNSEREPKLQVYYGHCNQITVKSVNFSGPNCEFVVSGSDCGRLFIWRKRDGELLRVMEGDRAVVNCIQSHPYEIMLASSGIENDIKIWTPLAKKPPQPILHFADSEYDSNDDDIDDDSDDTDDYSTSSDDSNSDSGSHDSDDGDDKGNYDEGDDSDSDSHDCDCDDDEGDNNEGDGSEHSG